MAIERLGFVDHFILMAERSRNEATKRTGLSFIEEKMASLIDRLLVAISSSYREYRFHLLNTFSATQAQSASTVQDVVHSILLPIPEEQAKPTEFVVQPHNPLKDPESDAGVDDNDPTNTDSDEFDLRSFFSLFDEEKEEVIEIDETVVDPTIPSLEKREVDEVVPQLDTEENVVHTTLPVAVDHPVLPEPVESTVVPATEQVEDVEIEDAEGEEEILTEEGFHAMTQLLWLQQGEAFGDLPDHLKKQYGMLLMNNPGYLAGLFLGFQMIDYQKKNGRSQELMDDAFDEMDINPLSDLNEEESDVECLEDDEEFFSLEESDDELGESENFHEPVNY